MKIALISFEYPPETAYGGIATYMAEISKMLSDNGHLVEVFCAGGSQKSNRVSENLMVHTIGDLDKDSFAVSLVPLLMSRNDEVGFDVVESSEIYGDSREVRSRIPELPLLVKLHTPSFLLHRLNYFPPTLKEKMRFSMGALRRGKLRWLKENLSILAKRNLVESRLYHDADVVVSPSRDLIRVIEDEWGMRPDGVHLLPNPFEATSELLSSPVSEPSAPLLYLGRLEIRKGFSDLINALVLLEKGRFPVDARFVGASFPSSSRRLSMQQWASARLPIDSGRYTFTGNLKREEALAELSGSGLVVLPSRWENFPYTCLEAMASGRVVIGSSAGGMADMIRDGETGFLVPPEDSSELAYKIVEVIQNSEKYAQIGESARNRVLTAYAHSSILPQQIVMYERAIRLHRIHRSENLLKNK